MRPFHPLKSTHWVILSSPILLLVLVFTLTTSSGSAPRRHRSSASASTTTAPATLSTTTLKVATTTTTVLTKAPNHVRVVAVPTSPATSSGRHVTSSSSATASSAKPVESAPAESASSGVLTGQLSPSFAVADVPLAGPGTWSVATSAPATLTLRCANQSVTVQGQFVIGARERCQLVITPATSTTSLTWQLTPIK